MPVRAVNVRNVLPESIMMRRTRRSAKHVLRERIKTNWVRQRAHNVLLESMAMRRNRQIVNRVQGENQQTQLVKRMIQDVRSFALKVNIVIRAVVVRNVLQESIAMRQDFRIAKNVRGL